MKILDNIPLPVKTVCWLQIVTIAVNLLSVVALLLRGEYQDLTSNVISVAIATLVLYGIIKKLKLIRVLSLVFSWITVLVISLSVIAGIAAGISMTFEESLMFLILTAIGFGVALATIWGLSHSDAKRYFSVRRN